MLDFLKNIGISVGIIILAPFVFIGLIMSIIKTKKHKAKYLECIRQAFGEDMETCFSVEKCDGKRALISFTDKISFTTNRIKSEYTNHKGWHKITDNEYVFLDNQMNGSICSFCHDFGRPYFRSLIYIYKREMRNSYFKELKKTLMSGTGWNLPDDAFVVGYIDYSNRRGISETIYFSLSECNPDEIRNQLDILVSTAKEWTKDGNDYHFSRSEDYNTYNTKVYYKQGEPFVIFRHFTT